jgi:hypothetical protein
MSTVRTRVHRVVAHIVATILRPGATYDPHNFRLWQRRGYHITPTHFYSPIPDTRDIEHKTFHQSDVPGIDLRSESQLDLITHGFAQFSKECNELAVTSADAGVFHLDNDAFSGIDPHLYHCMIRYFRPRTIVEVGSGHSTLLGIQAARLNGPTQYMCIDLGRATS